jgi:hypothetical protein
VLVPDYDTKPQRSPPLFPHGFVFILIFSLLACLAAGASIPLGIEVWNSRSKDAKFAAAIVGASLLWISGLLTTIAAVYIIVMAPRLRLWQRLLLIVPPTLAALMSLFTVIAAGER